MLYRLKFLVGCPRGTVPYDLSRCTYGIQAETEISGVCPAQDATFSKSLLSCAVWTEVEAQLMCPEGYRIVLPPLAKHTGPCQADSVLPAIRKCDPPYQYDKSTGQCIVRGYTAGWIGCRPGETLVGDACLVAYQERLKVSCPPGATPRFHPQTGNPECYRNITVAGSWNQWTQHPSCPEWFTADVIEMIPRRTRLNNATISDPIDYPVVQCVRTVVLPARDCEASCPEGTMPYTHYIAQHTKPKVHTNPNWGPADLTCVRVKRFPVGPSCSSAEEVIWISGADTMTRQAMLKYTFNRLNQSNKRKLQSLYQGAVGPWRSPMSYGVPGAFGMPWDFMSSQAIDTALAHRSNVPEPLGGPFGYDRFGGNRYGDRGYGYEPAAVDTQVAQADEGLGGYFGAGRYDSGNWIPGASGLKKSPAQRQRDEEAYYASSDAIHTYTAAAPTSSSSVIRPETVKPVNRTNLANLLNEALLNDLIMRPGTIIANKSEFGNLTNPDALTDKLTTVFASGLTDWDIDWLTPYLKGEVAVICESQDTTRPYLSCPPHHKLRADGSCKGYGYTDFIVICPEGFALNQAGLLVSEGTKKKKKKPMCAGLIPTATDFFCPNRLPYGERDGPTPADPDKFYANQTTIKRSLTETRYSIPWKQSMYPDERKTTNYAKQLIYLSALRDGAPFTETQREVETLESAWNHFDKERAIAESLWYGTTTPLFNPASSQYDSLEEAVKMVIVGASRLIPKPQSAEKLVGGPVKPLRASAVQSLPTSVLDAAFALTVIESNYLNQSNADDPTFFTHIDILDIIGNWTGWEVVGDHPSEVIADPDLKLCYQAQLIPAWYSPAHNSLLELFGSAFGGELILKAEEAKRRGGCSCAYALLPSPPLPQIGLVDIFTKKETSADISCETFHAADAFIEGFNHPSSSIEALRPVCDKIIGVKGLMNVEDPSEIINLLKETVMQLNSTECNTHEEAEEKIPTYDDFLKLYDLLMLAPQYGAGKRHFQ